MKAPEHREPKLYDTKCGVDPAIERNIELNFPGYSLLCACGRENKVFGQGRCQSCIEDDFVKHAEEFRAAVSQGNLQENVP